MKKYLVAVTRDATETTHVDVEATSPITAESTALAEAMDHPEQFNWVPDDGSGSSNIPYIADEGNSAEEITETEPTPEAEADIHWLVMMLRQFLDSEGSAVVSETIDRVEARQKARLDALAERLKIGE